MVKSHLNVGEKSPCTQSRKVGAQIGKNDSVETSVRLKLTQ